MTASSSSDLIVFYSWQSDLNDAINKQAIRSGLRVASNKIESENPAIRVIIDEATRDTPGSPNIPLTIMEKIRSCDVFVCDITTINSNAPPEFRRTPNPNVAFELGYAVAHLGWARVVLVFNEAVGSVKDAPFDIDRQRILSYKLAPNDPKNKGGLGQLSASLGLAVAAVVEHQPSKPISGLTQSPAQVRRNRDVANLNWVLSNIHFPTLDRMVEDLPELLHSTSLYFWEGFNAVVENSLFYLYDTELFSAIKSMHEAWGVCVSHGAQFHPGTSLDIYIFRNPGDAPFTERQEQIWEEIHDARRRLQRAMQDLLNSVRERYLEVDIEEANRAAWKGYADMLRDIEAQSERRSS